MNKFKMRLKYIWEKCNLIYVGGEYDSNQGNDES